MTVRTSGLLPETSSKEKALSDFEGEVYYGRSYFEKSI